MKKLFLPLIGLVLISISCEKNVSEQNNNSASKDVSINDNIKCESGVLVFKDQISLSNYENNANRMGISELTKQETSLGFESQKRIFEAIALKEYNIQIKPFEGKTDDEMKNIPFPGHCLEYSSALKSGIIKEINEPGGSYIDYNLTDRSKAVYLNKDGLVKVGNTLYFVKGNSIKSVENATLTNSRELLESSSLNSETSNPVIKSVLSGTYTAQKTTGWVSNGSKYRSSLDATYTIKTAGSNQGLNYSDIIQGFPLTINTNSQKKNFWGNWNQYWGEETISGPASLHLDWSQIWYGPYTSTNGLYNDFSTNYYFPSASNATLTYHPFTGAIVANSFGYSLATAPYNGFYGWGTKPINFNITAALPGGCCGIVLNVYW
jgi:hypothetical protein